MSREVRAFTIEYHHLSNVLATSTGTFVLNSLDKTKRKDVKAIWDTGATNSCISETVSKDLNLLPLGFVEVQTAGGKVNAKVYVVDIYLPHKVRVEEVRMTEVPLTGCDILIGMDIISLGDFAVSNFMGETTFTFRMPSVSKTDYVKNIYRLQAQDGKIGRNDVCPCGSGKKYKNCHGSTSK